MEVLELTIATRPAETVSTIDRYVSWWQKKGRPPKVGIADKGEAELLLGSLWGDVLAAVFKWEWCVVIHHDLNDVAAIAIASPDRSLVIYPMVFVRRCLANANVDCTIALTFNMMAAKKIHKLNSHGYVNLMECVRRVG